MKNLCQGKFNANIMILLDGKKKDSHTCYA